jgi:hypothetical protein
MNAAQLKLIKMLISLEKKDAVRLQYEDDETRQSQKESLHRYGIKEFMQLAKPVNPNPPTKLTDKPCSSPECFFCHPELLADVEADFMKN